MKNHLVFLTGSMVCGLAVAAPATAPATAPPMVTPISAWQSSLSALPSPDDPKRIDWRDSNQTVFRLGGHVGHWRGTLMSPAATSATMTPAPERKP